MSYKILTPCWELDLPTSLKIVLVSLADQANDNGKCFPAISNLTKRTGLSDRAVQKALRTLEDLGVISTEVTPGRASTYTLTPERYSPPEKADPRTTFTPERGSPPNHVHPTPERGSPAPEPRSPHGSVIDPPRDPDLLLGGEKSPPSRKRNAAIVPEVPEEQIAISLPITGTPSEYPITHGQVAEWAQLFPAVDVPQELRNMRAWCSTNRERRKTAGGVLRFVVHWLTKEQNQGGRFRGAPPPRQSAAPVKVYRPG